MTVRSPPVTFFPIPAKVGTHLSADETVEEWIPAWAGITLL